MGIRQESDFTCIIFNLVLQIVVRVSGIGSAGTVQLKYVHIETTLL
jgi:hypothetical protein